MQVGRAWVITFHLVNGMVWQFSCPATSAAPIKHYPDCCDAPSTSEMGLIRESLNDAKTAADAAKEAAHVAKESLISVEKMRRPNCVLTLWSRRARFSM